MKFILYNLQTSPLLILVQFCTINILFAQAPGCPNVVVSDDININCATSNTVNLSASYLEIGETTSYDVNEISYSPPFSYTGLANPISVGTDDVWSPVVNLPFNFCFYGNMYTECIISSNGAISFDTTTNVPSGYSKWYFNNTVPSANLFLNTIFGVYHDMDPSLGGDIAYELLGTSPCRKLVVSYHNVPLYSCRTSKSTFQIVLYETTNIIELYIEKKASCNWWNSGNSVVGIQNEIATSGLAAPGRNTSNWVVNSSNPEAWRFTPSGSIITSVNWYDVASGGNSIATSNDINVTPSLTTTYRAEVEYLMCDGSSIIESDTVTVNVDDCPSMIDFDGIDDFVLVDHLINNENAITNMAWINLDSNFNGEGFIIGESNSSLSVNLNKTISAKIETDIGIFTAITDQTISLSKWVHVASVFDGTYLKIYINGEESKSISVNENSIAESTTAFYIGKDPISNSKYINGAVQEVKVYNIALKIDQLREQIYQPINKVGSLVFGSITHKKISDDLYWNNLILYLPLNSANSGITLDNSNNSNLALLYHMSTAQQTTAPLPYIANSSGNWDSINTWQHGNVWDIDNLNNKDWAIVKITNNSKVITNTSRNHLGLIIDSGSELEVQNNQLLENTSFLKIDGHIDLVGESQLIQTETSDLATSSLGYVERDQKGKSSKYHYNYWSSPVSPINGLNNNLDYRLLDVLRDGTNSNTPSEIIFNSSGYDGASTSPISIADYWVFTFRNTSDNYSNWLQVRSTGNIRVGEGYTMKGTGTSNDYQNYVFKGKPNNGIIERAIGGDNIYLLGNPYLSALDANSFIMDNLGTNPVINGTLYFWEHWGGESHVLSDYEGGYATYNLLGGVMAVSSPMVSNNGSGLIQPKRYIPVSQGFFVKGDVDGGVVKFDNSQRVFKKESEGGSVFFRNSETSNEVENDVGRIYFEFKTPEGAIRELLLGVKSDLTMGVDNGYDGECIEVTNTDCSWGINSNQYVIQGIGTIHNNLELPLIIHVGTSGISNFSIRQIANINPDLNIYLRDKELNIDTELDVNTNIDLNLPSGTYRNRFYVVFKLKEVLELNTIEIIEDNLVVFYDNLNKGIKINNSLDFSANSIVLYNLLGQEVLRVNKEYHNVNEINIPLNVAMGTYILTFDYNNSSQLKRKVVIN